MNVWNSLPANRVDSILSLHNAYFKRTVDNIDLTSFLSRHNWIQLVYWVIVSIVGSATFENKIIMKTRMMGLPSAWRILVKYLAFRHNTDA